MTNQRTSSITKTPTAWEIPLSSSSIDWIKQDGVDQAMLDFFRHGIGWDLWWTDRHKSGISDTKYPPYNIIEKDEHNYQVELAVAGFGEEDLSITLRDGNLLVIEGKKEKEIRNYRANGIAARNFTRTFSLSDNMQIKGASLKNGMLIIDLEYVIPEEKKPKRIPIQT